MRLSIHCRWRAELHETLEAAGLTARLAPKMSVVIDGGGALGMGDVIADVRLTADAASRGWLIAIGAHSAHGAPRWEWLLLRKRLPRRWRFSKLSAAKGKMARGRELSDADWRFFLDGPPLRRR